MQLSPDWLLERLPDIIDLAPLSRGGQKVVYEGVHRKDGRIVLKVFHPEQQTEETDREILAVARIKSRRVPAILDHGVLETPYGSCNWLREPYIEGLTLRLLLQQTIPDLEALFFA